MFRHTLATELLEKGITVEHVAQILGNTPQIVYKHYSPWIPSRQKALDDAVMSVWG
jgi:predicted transcriptional regulator